MDPKTGGPTYFPWLCRARLLPSVSMTIHSSRARRGSSSLPGRFSRGAQLDTMVMEPLAMPAAPRPATKRPTMSMGEETAAPQSTDPTSNMAKNTRNAHCDRREELVLRHGAHHRAGEPPDPGQRGPVAPCSTNLGVEKRVDPPREPCGRQAGGTTGQPAGDQEHIARRGREQGLTAQTDRH